MAVKPISENAPEAAPEATARYFKGVDGITDGMNHHGAGAYFFGTDSVLAHFERTGGKDGKRVLYVEVPADEYHRAEASRLASIQDVELPEPEPVAATPQVTPNAFSDVPPTGEAPIGARPGQGAGFASKGENTMAGGGL